MDSIVNHTATVIAGNKVNVRQIKGIFNDIVQQFTESLSIVNDVISTPYALQIAASISDELTKNNNNNTDLILSNPSLLKHKFYILIRNTITERLSKLNNMDTEFGDIEKQNLNKMCYLFKRISQNVNNENYEIFENLILNKTFIEPMKQCLDDVAKNWKYLNDVHITDVLSNILSLLTNVRNSKQNTGQF
ncbi:unnamed protein product [Didymodactylos carnosus]|uniref:Uncharacterized protein n=1 Tax=Didymodactylos carnosus TaxID=1234261 RepID=A0A815YNS7_9BILA|nr:unnamed protein product [Didymodactylos carnosus]CAF4437568.1 unnamed protein product [Didymodactylos carnosus]